ncbi:radical SAM protein [Candidatus Woesearchaeota archaeon]|nr:radical SAM protein [Candidatus Woesearchaeota archaeon]
MEFKFEDIKFFQREDYVEGVFLDMFSLKFDNLKKLGNYEVKDKVLNIDISESKSHKFYNMMDKAFDSMTNKFNGKRTIYVHKHSDIPLFGNVGFGIVDRGTSLIEIKPITSCNLKCIYCSIDLDKRPVDFIVEPDYLVEELNKLIELKECNNIEIHIGCQGEPLRYSKLAYLINKIRLNENVKAVSMDTNATMLTTNKIDELIKSGITQFNISLDALDKGIADKLAGIAYNLDHVEKMIEYISKSDVRLLIAPLWVPKINDDEMTKIVEKYHEKADLIGIQKYLKYKQGRIQKEISWDKFFDKLKELEAKFNTKLILDEKDFNIIKTKEMGKPFKKNEIIKAEIVCPNNIANEKIAIARDRTISVKTDKTGMVKLRIIRTKHNIFYGEIIK